MSDYKSGSMFHILIAHGPKVREDDGLKKVNALKGALLNSLDVAFPLINPKNALKGQRKSRTVSWLSGTHYTSTKIHSFY